jgi:hypothetical protein
LSVTSFVIAGELLASSSSSSSCGMLCYSVRSTVSTVLLERETRLSCLLQFENSRTTDKTSTFVQCVLYWLYLEIKNMSPLLAW